MRDGKIVGYAREVSVYLRPNSFLFQDEEDTRLREELLQLADALTVIIARAELIGLFLFFFSPRSHLPVA